MDKFKPALAVPQGVQNGQVPAEFEGWSAFQMTNHEYLELVTGITARRLAKEAATGGFVALADAHARLQRMVAGGTPMPQFVLQERVLGAIERGTVYVPPGWRRPA